MGNRPAPRSDRDVMELEPAGTAALLDPPPDRSGDAEARPRTPAEVAAAFGIPDEELAGPDPARLTRLARIADHVVGVFGSYENGRRWLRSAPPVFGGETVLSQLATEEGTTEVDRVLGRIEHGVFS